MDGEKLKRDIGQNIAIRRRYLGLTQAELAEKLNYSDKAVSKWERGDSVPDVVTLATLAQMFSVRVDDLLREPSEDVIQPEEATPKKRVNRTVIQLLVSLLVWSVALLLYVVFDTALIFPSGVGFIYAIPINALVLMILRSAWKMYNLNHLLISILVWGSLASLYFSVLIFSHYNLWKLLLLGLAGQAAVTLWFFLFRHPREKKNNG